MKKSNKLKIVFPDEASVNLGDMDLGLITKHGSYQAYAHSTDRQLISRVKDADVIVTNKCIFQKQHFKVLPRLKLLCIAATGVNNIDLAAAKSRGIAVTNVRGYSTPTVAEHALLFMLCFSHRLLEHHRAVQNKKWSSSSLFTLLDFPFSDLRGKTLGIIGYGAIGRRVAGLARSFGLRVLVARLPGRFYRKNSGRLPLPALLNKSDFVSLHCPLSNLTHHLINQRTLRLMKRGAFLINLARGPIVDENHIVNFLRRDRIAGYATDVMAVEPPPKKHPFFGREMQGKILFSPHIAWASRESRQKLVDEIGENIQAYLGGKRRNRIV